MVTNDQPKIDLSLFDIFGWALKRTRKGKRKRRRVFGWIIGRIMKRGDRWTGKTWINMGRKEDRNNTKSKLNHIDNNRVESRT